MLANSTQRLLTEWWTSSCWSTPKKWLLSSLSLASAMSATAATGCSTSVPSSERCGAQLKPKSKKPNDVYTLQWWSKIVYLVMITLYPLRLCRRSAEGCWLRLCPSGNVSTGLTSPPRRKQDEGCDGLFRVLPLGRCWTCWASTSLGWIWQDGTL